MRFYFFEHPQVAECHYRKRNLKENKVEEIYKQNKKVLLRERKRHTARCVASARYAALSNGGGGGTPFSPGGGGYPRYPWPGLDGGGGTLDTPYHLDLVGVPPRPGMGYPPTI